VVKDSMTLEQARIKAKNMAYMYLHWSELFNSSHQPSLEDYLAQVIYETAQNEQELCRELFDKLCLICKWERM
jgi:hypothetical protein